MDGMKLAAALSGVSDKYKRQADIFSQPERPRAHRAWTALRWSAGMAAFLLLMGVFVFMGRLQEQIASRPGQEESPAPAGDLASGLAFPEEPVPAEVWQPLGYAGQALIRGWSEFDAGSVMDPVDCFGREFLEDLFREFFQERGRTTAYPSGAWYDEDGQLRMLALQVMDLTDAASVDGAVYGEKPLFTVLVCPGDDLPGGFSPEGENVLATVLEPEGAPVYTAWSRDAAYFVENWQGQAWAAQFSSEDRAGRPAQLMVEVYGQPDERELAVSLAAWLTRRLLPGNTALDLGAALAVSPEDSAAAELAGAVAIDRDGTLAWADPELARIAAGLGDAAPIGDIEAARTLSLPLFEVLLRLADPDTGEDVYLLALWRAEYGFYDEDGGVARRIGGEAGLRLYNPESGVIRELPEGGLGATLGLGDGAEKIIQIAQEGEAAFERLAPWQARSLLREYMALNGMEGWRIEDGADSPEREAEMAEAAKALAVEYVQRVGEDGLFQENPVEDLYCDRLAVYQVSADGDACCVTARLVIRPSDPADAQRYCIGNGKLGEGDLAGRAVWGVTLLGEKREEGGQAVWRIAENGTSSGIIQLLSKGVPEGQIQEVFWPVDGRWPAAQPE